MDALVANLNDPESVRPVPDDLQQGHLSFSTRRDGTLAQFRNDDDREELTEIIRNSSGVLMKQATPHVSAIRA